MSLLSFVPIIGQIVDKILPDKDEAEKAKAKLKLLETNGELELLLGQLEINKLEARHRSVFVAGWRPFIGWICAFAFLWHFILERILVFLYATAGQPLTLPSFDMPSLLTVMMGMLGLAGYRSFEKYKGVTK